jgi:hypothetical protein
MEWLIEIFMKSFILIISFLLPSGVLVHPMPNSVMILDFQPKLIKMELQLPIKDLDMAFGHDIFMKPDSLLEKHGEALKSYLQQHIHVSNSDGKAWSVAIKIMYLKSGKTSFDEIYQELVVQVWLKPPSGNIKTSFTLSYDAIIHQVVSHKILVTTIENNVVNSPVGEISLDIVNNLIHTLQIDNRQKTPVISGTRKLTVLDTNLHIERDEKSFMDMSDAKKRFDRFKGKKH